MIAGNKKNGYCQDIKDIELIRISFFDRRNTGNILFMSSINTGDQPIEAKTILITGMDPSASCGLLNPPLRGIVRLTNFNALRF